MKRSAVRIFLVISMMLLSVLTAGAAPLLQESSEISEGTDILRAVSVFSQIFSAGMEAAASQFAGGEMYGTDAATEEPAPEPTAIPTTIPTKVPTAIPTAVPTEIPTAIPTAVPTEIPTAIPTAVPTEIPTAIPTAVPTEIPTAIPTAVPTEIPTAVPTQVPTEIPTEEPAPLPPSDPEQYAVSFGIPVKDFYDSLKTMVKNSGRHSVSFEEKGRKSASKAVIDDDISVFLYYSKEKGENLINQINFEAKFSDSKQQQNAENIFTILLETLCGNYYDIAFDESEGSDLFALAMNNGSAYLGDLMLYGSAEPKNSKTNLIVKIYYAGNDYQAAAVSGYDQSAEDEFRSLVADMKQRGIIPESSGYFRYHEDYENEWAYIRWYQWESFDMAKNFVISADLEWHSASNTPNFEDAGCGFVLRAQDTNNNLYAALNMDGKVHFGGIHNGSWLGYKSFSYGSHSTKGTAQLVVVANEGTISAYVDGSFIGQQLDVAITSSGSLAFSTFSGTNKDYGTRCSFRNVYYYVW